MTLSIIPVTAADGSYDSFAAMRASVWIQTRGSAE